MTCTKGFFFCSKKRERRKLHATTVQKKAFSTEERDERATTTKGKTMKITSSLILLYLLQACENVIGYTYTYGTVQPTGRRLRLYTDYESLEGPGFDYGRMEGPGLNPFTLPPAQGHVPQWGYNERAPLTRYSDFNDYRWGAPAEGGPHMGPQQGLSRRRQSHLEHPQLCTFLGSCRGWSLLHQ